LRQSTTALPTARHNTTLRSSVLWSGASESVSLGALRLPCCATIWAGIVLGPTSRACVILLYRGVGMADVVLGAFGMLAVLAYIAFVAWLTTVRRKPCLLAVTAYMSNSKTGCVVGGLVIIYRHIDLPSIFSTEIHRLFSTSYGSWSLFLECMQCADDYRP